MSKSQYHNYLKSEKWKGIRSNIIKERKACEFCLSSKDLHIHHLDYEHVGFEDHRKMVKWLLLVCQSCHYKIHKDAKYRFANPFANKFPIPRQGVLRRYKTLIKKSKSISSTKKRAFSGPLNQ